MQTLLQYQSRTIPREDDETVLDALLRAGEPVPCSCRAGICQSCVLRATAGDPGKRSQEGLKDTLRARGYFLACVSRPDQELTIVPPSSDDIAQVRGTVQAKEQLNAEILRLTLTVTEPFEYRAGQFVTIQRSDGVTRSYSLASLPQSNGMLELHVRRLPGGQMSGWIHESLAVGDTIAVRGPAGNCFFIPRSDMAGMLLIGTGSGLAPLYGIVRDALAQGYTGPIHLYHGSYRPEGLYLVEELRSLAKQYPNMKYIACVDTEPLPGMAIGQADTIALSTYTDLGNWSVYLCGHPGMVQRARRRAYISGAALTHIYADPFVVASSGEIS